jgi:hypothetical protein
MPTPISFSDYAGLKDAIAQWMNRPDLEYAIPSFIALNEAAIRRKLRDTTDRATITIAAESTPIPANVTELRSLRLISNTPALDRAFTIATPEILDDFRARLSNVAGRPRFGCVVGGNLIVVPTPDQSYDADITFYSTLVPLSDAAPVNDLLTNSPDVYLWGSLAQAESFMEHDERIGLWIGAFGTALDELEKARSNREYGPSIKRARLPMVF